MSAPIECSIGASQIAAILGIDRFCAPEQLWRRMCGFDPPEPENEHMARGKFLEAGLCDWWCYLAKAERRERLYAQHGVVLGNGQLRVTHPEFPWCRATPDIVAECMPVRGDVRVLIAADTKCPSSGRKKLGEQWVAAWQESTQTAPLGYCAQSTFQVGVLRAAGVPVVAGELAAGPLWGKMERVLVPYDGEFFALMLERASVFRECVLAKKPLPSEFQQETES